MTTGQASVFAEGGVGHRRPVPGSPAFNLGPDVLNRDLAEPVLLPGAPALGAIVDRLWTRAGRLHDGARTA